MFRVGFTAFELNHLYFMTKRPRIVAICVFPTKYIKHMNTDILVIFTTKTQMVASQETLTRGEGIRMTTHVRGQMSKFPCPYKHSLKNIGQS